ncbi:protein kinase IKS1 [Sugiyamaella lignohabitans]|uniref:Protein kinase IKS1 n=1 Tax=Sugiyamaella lignohabitans TaxID=796027 RepID=A0A167F039_9ASCO|nr:protein kinase IKS1 [Sugiyamaella lignohabitans]ANB14655.1 protein kinase IKS1 [Sugiyamaella lignohabitans]
MSLLGLCPRPRGSSRFARVGRRRSQQLLPSRSNGVWGSAPAAGSSTNGSDRFFISSALLGRGSRGAVYLVEHVLDGFSLGFFALKKVAVGDDHAWLEKVLSEVNLLRMLSHPNLVRYNHVWLEVSSLSSFGPLVPCAYILQEYCNGGTLEEYMMKGRYKPGTDGESDIIPQFQRDPNDRTWTKNDIKAKRDRIRRRMSQQGADGQGYTDFSGRNGGSMSAVVDDNDDEYVAELTIEEIISFMTDIVMGVKYLHQNQIIHRDLKPSNCLLCRIPGQSLPTVLVSDFGEGQIEGLNRMGSGSTGTLEYTAPELVQTVSGRFVAQFSKKTDVFSLGMILHYLCFSRLPYSNVWQERGDLEALTGEVRQFGGFDINISNSKLHRTDLDPQLLALVDAMVSIDPDRRPTADQVLFILGQVNERYRQQQFHQAQTTAMSTASQTSPPPASSTSGTSTAAATTTAVPEITTNTTATSTSTALPINSTTATLRISDTSSSLMSPTLSPSINTPATSSFDMSSSLSSSLVPTVIYSPDHQRPNMLLRYLPTWIQRLAIRNRRSPRQLTSSLLLTKGTLLLIKLATIYKLAPSPYTQAIYMLLGVELATLSIPVSIGLFLAHLVLYSLA